MRKAWLREVDWPTIVSLNAQLCEGKALHKPTTDGYDKTRIFWEANHERELTLPEAIDICRQCHQTAPFCFFNGNTFMVVIRDCITHASGFSNQQIVLAKSLAGHMVAGTAEPEEITQFAQLLHDIEHGVTTNETLQPGTYKAGDRVQTPKGTLTGVITVIHADGAITWKCDQTGAEMTGTPNSLKRHSPT